MQYRLDLSVPQCSRKAAALFVVYILRHYRISTKPIIWTPALRGDILGNHRSKFVAKLGPICCPLAVLNIKSITDWAKKSTLDLGGQSGRQTAVTELRTLLEEEIKIRIEKNTKAPKNFKLLADVFLNHKIEGLKSYAVFGAK